MPDPKKKKEKKKEKKEKNLGDFNVTGISTLKMGSGGEKKRTGVKTIGGRKATVTSKPYETYKSKFYSSSKDGKEIARSKTKSKNGKGTETFKKIRKNPDGTYTLMKCNKRNHCTESKVGKVRGEYIRKRMKKDSLKLTRKVKNNARSKKKKS